MKSWCIENSCWAAPVLVGILSLIGTCLGNWLLGRKRVSIEVLSKNRQEWIKELRITISKIYYIISKCMILEIDNPSSKNENKEKFDKNINEINKLHAYLLVLLNPNEDNYKIMDNIVVRAKLRIGIIPKFASITNYHKSTYNDNLYDLNEINEELLKTAQTILKIEWERVKKGI